MYFSRVLLFRRNIMQVNKNDQITHVFGTVSLGIKRFMYMYNKV